MAQSFTTDITQWQGVDDVPTAGSGNLVKSGGIFQKITTFPYDFYIKTNGSRQTSQTWKTSSFYPIELFAAVYCITNASVNTIAFYGGESFGSYISGYSASPALSFIERSG